MLDLHYQIMSEIRFHPDIGEYLTYGIQAGPHIVIHDISTCRETVEQMADFFTKLQPDPVHLEDIIEDQLP